MKLILIVAVAQYFANLAGRELTWRDVFKGMAMVGVPMLLVLKQPDLGTALTYSPILLMGLFLGGISWRKGLIITLVGVIAIGGDLGEREGAEAVPEGAADELYQSGR